MEATVGLFVAVPFQMLKEKYLDPLIRNKICPEIGLDAKILDHYSPASQKELFQRLQDNGITYTFHFPFVDMVSGSPDGLIRKAVRERFRMAIEWVEAFLPQLVVCHTGYYPQAHGEIVEQWLPFALETFRWLDDQLRGSKTPWVIENVFERSPEEILPVFEGLKDTEVGMCLDVGHLNAFSETPLILWLQVLSHLIRHLHLHDNKGQRDEHLGIGDGKVDFVSLFKILVEKKAPVRSITIEPHQEDKVIPTIQLLKEICPYRLNI